jgi:Chalcone isomerase-like
MNTPAAVICAVLAFAAAQVSPVVFAQTAQSTARPPLELRGFLPDGRLAGRARLKVWGFQVYDASLWVSSTFQPTAFQNHPFALDLEYLRDFSRDDIAKRSLKEMLLQKPLPADKVARWEQQLRDGIPNVRQGDRITGLHRPGEGLSFLFNGEPFKTIADPELAQLFFGIWLSEATSEPALRRELLSLPKQ